MIQSLTEATPRDPKTVKPGTLVAYSDGVYRVDRVERDGDDFTFHSTFVRPHGGRTVAMGFSAKGPKVLVVHDPVPEPVTTGTATARLAPLLDALEREAEEMGGWVTSVATPVFVLDSDGTSTYAITDVRVEPHETITASRRVLLVTER